MYISVGNTRINTICLPFDEEPQESHETDVVTVAGWGYTQTFQDEGNPTYCNK